MEEAKQTLIAISALQKSKKVRAQKRQDEIESLKQKVSQTSEHIEFLCSRGDYHKKGELENLIEKYEQKRGYYISSIVTLQNIKLFLMKLLSKN